jgi:hypothetical protein
MIVTVIAVTMVQLPLEEVINVIAVRNCLMPTIVVSAGTIDSVAFRRVLTAHFNDMLIIMPIMSCMQVSMMDVIDMPTVLNSGMTAMLTVNMCMVRVCRMVHMSVLLYVCLKMRCEDVR